MVVQQRKSSWLATLAGTALLSGGLATAAGLGAAQDAAQPDPAALAEGKSLYVENCQPCHGPAGKGDGPAARFLDSKPRDLTAGEWLVIEDGSREEIARVVSTGVEGTDMEPFSEILTEEEIDTVALYVVTEIVPQDAEDDGR